MPSKKKNSRSSSRPRKHEWTRWSTRQLLDLRLCDLHLGIEGTVLEDYIARLQEELDRKDLLVRPYFWLSDDWFTPGGTTGSAIPFYLAHPRLIRLERSQMGEVEGGTREWCMRLLRHETGHVVSNSFLLHRRRRWQQLFGLSSHRYPRFYRPNPYSRRYVQHLEYWYAQSHPDEDFAETFAVWLKPRSQWSKRYKGWPVMKKLRYVDALMADIAGEKPMVRTRKREDTLPTLRMTLGEHYRRKKEAYANEHPNFYDRDLKRVFTTRKLRGRRPSASAFIRRIQPDVLRLVARWTGDYRYQLDHVLKDMIGRCRELKLYVSGSERRTKLDFAILLTKHTMDSLYRNRRWMEM